MLSSLSKLLFGETAEVLALRRQVEESAERLAVSETLAAERLAVSETLAAERLALAAERLAVSEAANTCLEKAAFFEHMRTVASQASKLSPSSGLRLEVAPISDAELEAVLGGPLGAAPVGGAIQHSWIRACTTLQSSWSVMPDILIENEHVHPVMKAVLEEALPPNTRLWCNVIAPDDIPYDQVRPDFLVAHARDAAPSLLGSIALVEVKLQGNLRDACLQGANYLSRRMYRQCCERDARGEAIHNLVMFGVALDGHSVMLLRMSSGAPPPGSSYVGAKPCPVQCSPDLPLLPWKWSKQKPPLPLPPPSLGFRALSALLCTASVSSAAEAPLESLRVCLLPQRGEEEEEEEEEGGAVEAEKPEIVTLSLSLRLGRGGCSDVYAASGECEEVLGLAPGSLCGADCLALKLPRWSSKEVGESFLRERTALAAVRSQAIAGNALSTATLASLPQCLAYGWLPELRGRNAVQWPVLLLQPQGIPLTRWIAQRCSSSSSSSSASSITPSATTTSSIAASSATQKPSQLRMQCATQVALCCARALRAAASAGWVHCDLRPSNIVIRGGGSDTAVLVDWGSSRRTQEDCLGEGVAVFAHERLRAGFSCMAHSGLDASALLLSWVSIVWNEHCDAPWGGTLPGLFEERKQWLMEGAKHHQELSTVLVALNDIDLALHAGVARNLAALEVAELALATLLKQHGALPPV